MTASERAFRAAEADALCQQAYASVGAPDTGVALVAVGGYGRQELAPYSDLDVVLVHDDGVATGDWAGQVWYPLWDSGFKIDHSVRSVPEVLEQAASDLKVALGMLDVRHLAGDPNLTLRLRTAILAAWRRDAKDRLPELQQLVRDRYRLLGELAHNSVPDLKEATGGLRDATVLKALVATWLVDVPHGALESCRQAMIDVRDALHTVAGRGNDRIAPEMWADMAPLLDLPDAGAVQLHVRTLGRRMTHLSRLTWRRADAVLRRPPKATAGRRPQLESIGGGLAVAYEEIVLDRDARPAEDPFLLLRAAAEAAERDLVLEPTTTARIVAGVPPLPEPWPAEARDLLVRLLAAGPGLLAVWETLDETDALDTFLPEWERVRLLPHASTVHRFTVDRHLVETAASAAALTRRVARPDLLLLGALLHDIGKGLPGDHTEVGMRLVAEIAPRLGLGPADAGVLVAMVRHHLLLPDVATRRDLNDPATARGVADAVGSLEVLELLHALTEADSAATGPAAWSAWKGHLIADLVRRASALLSGQPEPPPATLTPEQEDLVARGELALHLDGELVTVIAPDREGLLSLSAGVLALHRLDVRAASVFTRGSTAVTVFRVSPRFGSMPDWSVVLGDLRHALDGSLPLEEKLAAREAAYPRPAVPVAPSTVRLVDDASETSTVVEVRAPDEVGVLHRICAVLASHHLDVRSAHISTLGHDVVDAFYVPRLSDEGRRDAVVKDLLAVLP
ncbi:MAG: [protein-PII] uridylyltransferase [Mycobacteriales bacterium]